MNYFTQYGLLIVFVVVFLEYLNLPGLPAGVVLPLSGVYASNQRISIFWVVILSLISAMLASWVMYYVGKFAWKPVKRMVEKRFPKCNQIIEERMSYLRQKGAIGVFICKLIPVARTIIPLPAGALNINFFHYTISSAIGILIYNSVFIGAGYVVGVTFIG